MVVSKQHTLDVNDPTLPRKRRTPSRYETGTGIGHSPSFPEELYQQQYFESLDLIVPLFRKDLNQVFTH